MNITDTQYFFQYNAELTKKIQKLIDAFDFSEINIDFGYSTQTAAH
jgi:hypothetical protein